VGRAIARPSARRLGATVPEPTPTQPSLRRLRAFGIRPNRELGQNFLIDSNLLGVIERLAELDAGDVVLEIGGGLGVLSEYLAPRVAHVHVVELDRRLEAALRDATDVFDNVSLHWGDAMALDLAALDPPPNKVVANLPYGIAAGVLLRTIEDLPGVTRWVTMVQREVGERLAAGPGSGTYGATSVLAQLAGAVRVARAVSRTVFQPVPNVDSVLVVVQRAGPAPSPAMRALVHGAFAHRRKALARSLTLATGGGGVDLGVAAPSRDAIREALVAMGRPADARAETLSPEAFRELGRRLGIEA